MSSRYVGCAQVETSTANQEIIQQHKPLGWNTDFKLRQFSFLNVGTCTVSINGGDAIYLAEKQGFRIDNKDEPISTFRIIEGSVSYTYWGAY